MESGRLIPNSPTSEGLRIFLTLSTYAKAKNLRNASTASLMKLKQNLTGRLVLLLDSYIMKKSPTEGDYNGHTK
jgi:hypothetical protein